MNYNFDIAIAQELGVSAAIVVQNLQFWIKKNEANDKHFHDGRYWTFNSMKAWHELFPFWTERQIRKILDDLVDKKIIIKGNYNEMKYDRTLWYAFTDYGITILQTCQMKETTLSNQSDKNVEPIPDINTDINQITISEAKASLEKEFDFEEECLKIQQDDRPKYRYGKIVVWFLQEKGIVPINRQQWKQLFTRNIRTARLLADWSDNQILDALDRIKKNPNLKDEWTLETINKYIMK